MKFTYETPQIEVIEIELEGVLCTSGDDLLEDVTSVGVVGDWN